MSLCRVSEATGRVLDWMVAKCEGHQLNGPYECFDGAWCLRDPDGSDGDVCPSYSTNWSQGGPIKTDNRISTQKKHDGWWLACIYDLNDEMTFVQLDHNELIAAMRCYVASKLGDVVDVPEELG